MYDLTNFTNASLTIIGVLLTIVSILIWIKLNAIEEKVEMNSNLHHECQEELPQKIVTKLAFSEHRQDFKEWQEGRKELGTHLKAIHTTTTAR